jgi:hypothetical protein
VREPDLDQEQRSRASKSQTYVYDHVSSPKLQQIKASKAFPFVYTTSSRQWTIQTTLQSVTHSLSLDSAEDDIGSLLGNHVRRHSGEGTRDAREDRRIDNPQTSRTPNIEVGVQHSHLVAISTDGAGGRCVVSPSSVLGVGGNLLGSLNILARQDLGDRDELALEGVTGEVDSLSKGSEILLVVASTGVEVVVGDGRHIERVGRLQHDGTGVVTGVGLQDGPREDVVRGGGIVCVTGEVSTEVDGATEDEDIVVAVFGRTARVEHGGTETGGSVGTAVTENGAVVSRQAVIGCVTAPGAAVECGEVGGDFA